MSVKLVRASSRSRTVEVVLPASTVVTADTVLALDPAKPNTVKVSSNAPAIASTDVIVGTAIRDITAANDKNFAVERKITVRRDEDGEYEVTGANMSDPLGRDDVNFTTVGSVICNANGTQFRATASRITSGTDGVVTGKIVAWS